MGSRDVREIEHLWISMPDGVKLSARLWLPAGAEAEPVPALFEYIPYRKADMVRARDERNHPYFAAHGYACLRIDMRGSGDSEGHMPDMYSAEELTDARHVIEWISRQTWCNGSVGMFGTSWGGTAGLQAAIDGPAALKTVIAVCATHDRYEDDIHHKGGLLLTDSIEWGATLPAILAMPPTVTAMGRGWRRAWQDRLNDLTFPLENWVREEERSPYWQRGSIALQADRISCPVLAVGGWSDRYSNSVMSLIESCPGKVWGIVGPWGHHYPDVGHPGPAMGFQQEALRWWDFWMRGQGSDGRPQVGCGHDGDLARDWPRLRAWVREFDPPSQVLNQRNGHWVEVDGPPSEISNSLRLYAKDTCLNDRQVAGQSRELVPHDLRVGLAAGDTGYFGRFGGLPTDQGIDDSRSLTFETEPLSEALVLFGAAALELDLHCDQPLAQIAVRLVDIAPNGQASRVGLTCRNLALSDDLCRGQPLTPGRIGRYRVRFPTTAYRFAAGHRIRLSLSCSYWPLVWPSPSAGRLELAASGTTQISLPVLQVGSQALARPMSLPREAPPAPGYDQVSAPLLKRSSEVMADGTLTEAWHQPFSSQRFHATATTFGYQTKARHCLQPEDPTSASSRFDHRLKSERPDGTAQVESWAQVTSTKSHFLVAGGLTACWDGAAIATRQWSSSIPRRLS
ncbi:MAG: CocE/NonD family hydrolase [Pseudomonadota bacterium]